MPAKTKATIRLATSKDTADLKALAKFATENDGMDRSTDGIKERLFGKGSSCAALVADLDGPVVGVAHFHFFTAALVEKPVIWLDDLFVVKPYRKQGIGEQLLVELARICKADGYAQIDFTASSLSPRAIRFYRRLGAKFFIEPRYGRLTASAMKTARAKRRARKLAARKRAQAKPAKK
ncbi:MAG: GNAT family N-acetyltransferase [Verrucomicrobiota bacterium]